MEVSRHGNILSSRLLTPHLSRTMHLLLLVYIHISSRLVVVTSCLANQIQLSDIQVRYHNFFYN